MLVNDRQHIDTLGCRLSAKLCRREAGVPVRKGTDNPMDKGCLSRREEVGCTLYSKQSATHYPIHGRICQYGFCFR